LFLDEDEFSALAITDEEHVSSLKALDELLKLAKNGALSR
jgi:hypothetical protein